MIDALSVGLAQCLAAVLPGLSRSGSTLSVGLLRGINRQAALDYSFVIGIPSILAAAVLEFKDAMVEGAEVPVLPMIIGVVVAAVVGFCHQIAALDGCQQQVASVHHLHRRFGHCGVDHQLY